MTRWAFADHEDEIRFAEVHREEALQAKQYARALCGSLQLHLIDMVRQTPAEQLAQDELVYWLEETEQALEEDADPVLRRQALSNMDPDIMTDFMRALGLTRAEVMCDPEMRAFFDWQAQQEPQEEPPPDAEEVPPRPGPRDMNLADFGLTQLPTTREEYLRFPVSVLKCFAKARSLSTVGCLSKQDLVDVLMPASGGAATRPADESAATSAAYVDQAASVAAKCGGASGSTGSGAPGHFSKWASVTNEGTDPGAAATSGGYPRTAPPRVAATAGGESLAPLEYWTSQQEVLRSREVTHAQQGPRTRRQYSWARSLAFARVWLGASGVKMRRGGAGNPCTVWVLGCTKQVEVDLAEGGFFDDANWVDQVATEVVLMGQSVTDPVLDQESAAQDGAYPIIRSVSYSEAEKALKTERTPDLVAVFMPDPLEGVPLEVIRTAPSDVPVVFFCRTEPPALVLKRRLALKLLRPPTRCPFSALAAAPAAAYDDNGWVFAVSGLGAFTTALDALRSAPRTTWEDGALTPVEQRRDALFWGIVDLKYDASRPLMERVKVLETGDGRISKFSHEGAVISERVNAHYKLVSANGTEKYTVVSTDKRLTHDIMDQGGYGHLVCRQACFPMMPAADLAERIAEELELRDGLKGDATIVLKLCNRSRAAGVLMVAASDLEATLAELLAPPEGDRIEQWLDDHARPLLESDAGSLGFSRGAMQEHLRHWWSNEGPSFVAEVFAESMLIECDGKEFDGTMRVSFVLRHRSGKIKPGMVPAPEDLEVDWIGGYWKLPSDDVSCPDVRLRSVSAARSAGTLQVKELHLQEVYAALGDSMQRLFGGAAPSLEQLMQWNPRRPELAAFLGSRLGMSGVKDKSKDKAGDRAQVGAKLASALALVDEVERTRPRLAVESFNCRARGILAVRSAEGGARDATPATWEEARAEFLKAVSTLPTSANARFWLGMAGLELSKLEEALKYLNHSLVLDPDFKGPYVNLGAVYLRLGKFDRAIQVSNACLARFPQSPQCYYHIGVASYQLAVQFYEAEATEDSSNLAHLVVLHLAAARENLELARESAEAGKLAPQKTGRTESPWLPEDERMLEEARALADARDPAPMCVPLPDAVGWRFMNYRT